MLRHLRTRRGPRYGAHICALTAALLLLLSVCLLHSRLSFFTSRPYYSLPHNYSPSYDPLLDDLDSDSISTSKSNEDRIDELDDAVLDNSATNEDILAEEEEEDAAAATQNQNTPDVATSDFFFDPVRGVVRRSFNRRSIEEWEDYVPFNLKFSSDLGFGNGDSELAFGSDDVLVDEKLRNKLSGVRKIEDALLLKGSGLREGWGEWFEKKGDFLRRDRMFKSNVEILNPLSNPILQDPDGVGMTELTRGDKIYLKGVLNEFKRTPFMIKKTLSVHESEIGIPGKKGSPDREEVKRVGRRTLNSDDSIKVRSDEGLKNVYNTDGTRWGYYPGLDGRLSFGNFMDAFFRRGRCNMRVFMVWNSPAWMFGVRHLRAMESLLYHHPNACVVVFSETMELNFFSRFLKDGYKVAVVTPNLDELLKDTSTEIYASRWHEWKKTKLYPTHYNELIRLASLYKYGGIYLDSDVIVLKPLSKLNNSIGFEDKLAGKTLNGAVMAFRKHSPFILECLEELFYASSDDDQLGWKGGDILTRVASRFLSNKEFSDAETELLLQPSSVFLPVGHNNILRYFTAPGTETDKQEQDVLLSKILEQSLTFHFWNSLTSALVPDSKSLVSRLLNRYCIHCSDMHSN